MNKSEFIQHSKNKPLTEVALLLNKKPKLDKEFILSQINGIQKAKNKLPEFYNTPNIIYPSKLSMEQCSSERTGIYKSQLIEGNSLIDLTGGFGVDSFYFSKNFTQITYVEKNVELVETVKNNFGLLKVKNVNILNTTAEDFINSAKEKVDVIYIDPSRRNENQRVFKLNECTPNTIELAPQLFKIADKILIKTAPLLDIKLTLKDLKCVTNVWVVSVNNDCKEVLYLLEKDKVVEPKINTINLTNSNQEFYFDYKTESNSLVEYSPPKNYLYEPNSSIMKAGAFNSICNHFSMKKLAKNTHLYTSENLIENFPGRTFKIETVINYSLKDFKKLGIKKANVSCRNFKDSVEQVQQKLKLKDGGGIYLFATTDSNNKPILIISVKIKVWDSQIK